MTSIQMRNLIIFFGNISYIKYLEIMNYCYKILNTNRVIKRFKKQDFHMPRYFLCKENTTTMKNFLLTLSWWWYDSNCCVGYSRTSEKKILLLYISHTKQNTSYIWIRKISASNSSSYSFDVCFDLGCRR